MTPIPPPPPYALPVYSPESVIAALIIVCMVAWLAMLSAEVKALASEVAKLQRELYQAHKWTRPDDNGKS